MRTSLKYGVEKRQRYDSVHDKMVNIIKSRGFEFFVTGAKSETEHHNVITSFSDYLRNNGYSSDSFGTGSWEENVRDKTTYYFEYLYISVNFIEDKEEIENLYREWKVTR